MATDQPSTSGATTLTEQQISERWPGIEFAYEFVRPSYDLITKRFEVVEGRIRGLLTLAVTVTFGVPVFVKAILDHVNFNSIWFGFALLALTLNVVLGMSAQVRGTIRLYDPRLLYNRSLHLTEWRFKKDVLYVAGQDFAMNAAAIRVKGNIAITMAILLLIQVAFFGAWALLDN